MSQPGFHEAQVVTEGFALPGQQFRIPGLGDLTFLDRANLQFAFVERPPQGRVKPFSVSILPPLRRQDFTACASTTSPERWLGFGNNLEGRHAATATSDSSALFGAVAVPGTLREGAYSGRVEVFATDLKECPGPAERPAIESLVIPVEMVIAAPRATRSGQLRLTLQGLTIRAIAGGPKPPSRSFGVANTGTGRMFWSSEVFSEGDWLAVEPACPAQGVDCFSDPGAAARVEIQVDPTGLPSDTYYGQIKINSDNAVNSPRVLTVALEVATLETIPQPTVLPAGLGFVDPAPAAECIEILNPSNEKVSLAARLTSPKSAFAFAYDNPPAELSEQCRLRREECPLWESSIDPASPAFRKGTVPARDSEGAGCRTIPIGREPKVVGEESRRETLELSFRDQQGELLGENVDVDLLLISPQGGEAAPLTAVAPRGQENPPFHILVTRAGENMNCSEVGAPLEVEAKLFDNRGQLITEKRVSRKDLDVRVVYGSNVPKGLDPIGDTWETALLCQPSESDLIISGTLTLKDDGQTLTRRRRIPMNGAEGPGDRPEITAVVSSAHPEVTGLAPGALITIWGNHLAPPGTSEIAMGGELPFELGEEGSSTVVRIGDQLTPVLFVSPTQINTIMPFRFDPPIENFTDPQLVVWRRDTGREVNTQTLPKAINKAEARPAVFVFLNTTQQLQPVIVTPDFKLVGESNPAVPGGTIVIAAAGLGAVTKEFPIRQPAPGGATVAGDMEVKIGGETVPEDNVVHAASWEGFHGLYQVNVVLPLDVVTGCEVEVMMIVDGQSSPPVRIPIEPTDLNCGE